MCADPGSWGVPVDSSRERTSAEVRWTPASVSATLDSEAAAPATMGLALEVPPNEEVYQRLGSEPPCRPPYPVVVTHSPQPCRFTREPNVEKLSRLRSGFVHPAAAPAPT